MSDYGPAGAHYLREAVQTATPAARLVMLYDRLVSDLARAEAATLASLADHETANRALQHAQEIVAVLDATLDVTAWSGAEGLRSLYRWLLELLLRANLRKDPELVRAARATAEPLRDAWRGAALRLAGSPAEEAVSRVA